MKRFSALYDAIDSTTSTNAKVGAMVAYLSEAPPADAAWAVFFLTGRRLKRLVPYPAIHEWTLAATGLDGGCSRKATRSSATAPRPLRSSLIRSPVAVASTEDVPLSEWVEIRILPLRELGDDEQSVASIGWWMGLDRLQRFMLLKILTGELRVGVSHTLVVRALAQAASLPATTIAARMMGDWTPTADGSRACCRKNRPSDDRSRPYPFFLASPLEDPVDAARTARRVAG